jgi:hypothetical protein
MRIVSEENVQNCSGEEGKKVHGFPPYPPYSPEPAYQVRMVSRVGFEPTTL